MSLAEIAKEEHGFCGLRPKNRKNAVQCFRLISPLRNQTLTCEISDKNKRSEFNGTGEMKITEHRTSNGEWNTQAMGCGRWAMGKDCEQ
jgi:hypothetical protein